MRAGTIPCVFVSIKGRPVFVVDVGAGDQVVVLHSGWIGTWEDWAPQVAALSRFRRVIAFDHRGAGRTPGLASELCMDRLVDDLLELIETFGLDRCVLGGFSTGSQVVQHALSRAPDRFSAVILMCPSGDAAPDPAFLDLLTSDFGAAVDQFVQACLPEAIREDVAPVRKWARDVLHQSEPANAVRLLQTMMSPSPALAGMQLPDIPALILQGDSDPFSPVEYGHALAERFPSASGQRVIHGSGHLLAMTRPAESVAAIQRFLSDPGLRAVW